ncbi:MAG TPA: LptF/LptG family permease [Verrucomicrobiae bacterium]|nr:LptF/LptG family permease [Verrucomicrobiae bacterium]
MRTLHSYIVRQVLVTLSMTVAVFTFVLMLGSAMKEILGLLVAKQTGFVAVIEAIGLLIPFVMAFALPMGLLTAALLVFGRFSADNELTAMRASGVSLLSLTSPVFLLSIVLSGVAGAINLEIAPRCRTLYRELLFQVGMSASGTLIPEKTYIKDFPDAIVYVSKVQGTNLQDVLIYEIRHDQVESYTRADEGTIHFDYSNRVISVVLHNATVLYLQEGQRLPRSVIQETAEFSYTNTITNQKRFRVDVSDMTFLQLRAEMKEVEKRTSGATVAATAAELRQKLRQLAAQKKDLMTPLRVQMHRQVSFSFACIGFTLVGVPLGIRAHRRETTFGIAAALLLVIIYYSFFILGLAMETHPDWAPHLILWIPNFLFQALGAVLLWRANRGI